MVAGLAIARPRAPPLGASEGGGPSRGPNACCSTMYSPAMAPPAPGPDCAEDSASGGRGVVESAMGANEVCGVRGRRPGREGGIGRGSLSLPPRGGDSRPCTLSLHRRTARSSNLRRAENVLLASLEAGAWLSPRSCTSHATTRQHAKAGARSIASSRLWSVAARSVAAVEMRRTRAETTASRSAVRDASSSERSEATKALYSTACATLSSSCSTALTASCCSRTSCVRSRSSRCSCPARADIVEASVRHVRIFKSGKSPKLRRPLVRAGRPSRLTARGYV